jgi:hypothetical protein
MSHFDAAGILFGLMALAQLMRGLGSSKRELSRKESL